MKPLLISSGEPSGIGPDLCLALSTYNFPVVILGDKTLLAERAAKLNLPIAFKEYRADHPFEPEINSLYLLSTPCRDSVVAGKLNVKNAAYVINMLSSAAEKCLRKEFSGLVTAPIHKAVINQAGIPFSGHTEFLATYCNSKQVVMLFFSPSMKIALVTTHLPLKAVPEAISEQLIGSIIRCLHHSLEREFGISNPRLYVAGLNPHAGENGYLGREEITVIEPALRALQKQGIDVQGPFPADTLFTPANCKRCDVFVAMYHDQGLPILKYTAFDSAVNVTLGLPFIRTSVDHGTALNLAGKGIANPGSLIAAVNLAMSLSERKESYATH